MITPNYYAIIPAKVRYNKDLTFLEKFLYCELTALSNVDGYCIASNKYFADLYEKDQKTISRAFTSLEKQGFISIEYEKVGARVTKRKIFLNDTKNTSDKIVNRTEITSDKNITREQQKLLSTVDKIVTDNNVSYNTILSLIMYNIEKDKKEIIKSFNFDKDLEDSIYEWLQYKKEKKQTYQSIGLKKLLTKLKADMESNGKQYVIEAIDNSIVHNYSGIYPANGSTQQVNGKSSSKNFTERNYTDNQLNDIFSDIHDLDIDI